MKKLKPNIEPIENWKEMVKEGPVQYWGFFSKKELEANKGKLLMLDIDFGRACSLRCPTCFRRKNVVDNGGIPDMSYNELLTVLKNAKKLGLKTIKYCGAGEPFENPLLLQFLRDLKKLGVGSAIFTKGHVLGDNKLARKIFAGEGVKNALDLCGKIYSFKTSILLSYQSFYSEIQDKLVGRKGHTKKRNKALENLAQVGFNKTSPTRLAMICAPIIKQIKDEVLNIYIFARKRNIYPVPAYLMVSGKQLTKKFLRNYDLTSKEKIELHSKIYKWNIEQGLQTVEQIENEGIPCMAGIHPCNQVAAGLYLTLNGNVTSCPGDNRVIGNVRKESIKEIWEKSENFKRRGTFNCRCPPKDGKTIPLRLYREVLERIKT
ncbi:MAG: radical SAM protein [Candidatus Diapherotrites archaeon]